MKLNRLLLAISLVFLTALPALVYSDGTDTADNYVAGTGAGANLETDGTGFRGTGNVFIGVSAGYADTTGSANVGIGYRALTNLTTGRGNIAIGYVAGESVTTGSDGLFINNRYYPSYGIFGTFSTGYFGINNTSPVSALDVTGAVKADSLNIAGDVAFAGDATVTGDITISGRAYVDSLSNPAGALVIPDSLSVKYLTDFAEGFTVTGTTYGATHLIVDVTTNMTLTSSDYGKTYFARALPSKKEITLWDAAAGANSTFIVDDADTLQVTAAAGDTIYFRAAGSSTLSAYKTLASIVANFKAVGASGNSIYIESYMGTNGTIAPY